MTDQPPTLRDEKVILRPARSSDAADRLAAGRDAEYVWSCGGDPRDLQPLSAEEAEQFVRVLAADPLGWAIEHAGRCIGSARLHGLNREDRRARYAVGLFDRRVWGQGLGTAVTRLVLRHAFESLGLHRVDLRVLADNERAIRVYLKCWFTHEGIERESARVGEVWRSDVMMSILEEEYRHLAPGWFAERSPVEVVRPAAAADLQALLDLAATRRAQYAT